MLRGIKNKYKKKVSPTTLMCITLPYTSGVPYIFFTLCTQYIINISIVKNITEN